MTRIKKDLVGMNFNLPTDLAEQLDQHAEDNFLQKTQVVEKALREYLDNYELEEICLGLRKFGVNYVPNHKSKYAPKELSAKDVVLNTDDFRISQNGMVFGMSGSGKTVLIKEKIKKIMEETQENVAVIDMCGEYTDLVEKYGGRIITDGTDKINPFEIYLGKHQDLDPALFKVDVAAALLCDMSYKNELTLEELSTLATAVRRMYCPLEEKILADENFQPTSGDFPTINSLLKQLLSMNSSVGQDLALMIDPFLNKDVVFNGGTTVEPARLMVFQPNQRFFGTSRASIKAYIEWVWTVFTRRGNITRQWLFIDSIDSMLSNENTITMMIGYLKRSRKRHISIIGVSESITDVVANSGLAILTDLYSTVFLNQSALDREYLRTQYHIPKKMLEFVSAMPYGVGLLADPKEITPITIKL
ncbi:MAG: DUF87 domain-containing protein [Lachnospiraceae bacterium]|nr:DUF87 domain-containing protein [Lachnospiraceae bacterium]